MPNAVRDNVFRFLDALFPKRRLVLEPRLVGALRTSPLCVIDVGGAMGPDARWLPLPRECVRFMTFEPDARSVGCAGRGSPLGDVTLAQGLSDTAGERTLFLTAGSFASSFYRPNEHVLRDFAI